MVLMLWGEQESDAEAAHWQSAELLRRMVKHFVLQLDAHGHDPY